jgi:Lrp/AsnC family leucine-responsive transcriptional regulator
MPNESAEVDRIDREILGILRIDGRITWRDLGDRVHLGATSTAERVRRLERDGVITGYGARVDAVRLGRGVRAVVDVALGPGDLAVGFEQRLARRDEVVFAAYVTGAADYFIVVECSDAEGLDAFVRWLRSDEAVSRTESHLMLRAVVDRN